MGRGVHSKARRVLSRKAERGDLVSKPKRGQKRTKQESERIKKSQQEWINTQESREYTKFVGIMASKGITSTKDVMEHFEKYTQMKQQTEEKLKAHLQDQECK